MKNFVKCQKTIYKREKKNNKYIYTPYFKQLERITANE